MNYKFQKKASGSLEFSGSAQVLPLVLPSREDVSRTRGSFNLNYENY